MKVKNNNSILRLGSSRACQQFNVLKSLWLQTAFCHQRWQPSKCRGEPALPFLPNWRRDERHSNRVNFQADYCIGALFSSSSLEAKGSALLTSEINNYSSICQCITHNCAAVHTDVLRKKNVFQNARYGGFRFTLPDFTFSFHSGGDTAASCIGSGSVSLAVCEVPSRQRGGA